MVCDMQLVTSSANCNARYYTTTNLFKHMLISAALSGRNTGCYTDYCFHVDNRKDVDQKVCFKRFAVFNSYYYSPIYSRIRQ